VLKSFKGFDWWNWEFEPNLSGFTGTRSTGFFGGAGGIRTPDLLDAIEARSQLRHGPTGMEMIKNCSILATRGQTRNMHRISRRLELLISLSADLNLSRPQLSRQIEFNKPRVVVQRIHLQPPCERTILRPIIPT
jgi:hypothetical protein